MAMIDDRARVMANQGIAAVPAMILEPPIGTLEHPLEASRPKRICCFHGFYPVPIGQDPMNYRPPNATHLEAVS